MKIIDMIRVRYKIHRIVKLMKKLMTEDCMMNSYHLLIDTMRKFPYYQDKEEVLNIYLGVLNEYNKI